MQERAPRSLFLCNARAMESDFLRVRNQYLQRIRSMPRHRISPCSASTLRRSRPWPGRSSGGSGPGIDRAIGGSLLRRDRALPAPRALSVSPAFRSAGVLALELASHMRERGAEVDAVILLDTLLPQGYRRNWFKWLSHRSAEMLDGHARRVVQYSGEASRQACKRAAAEFVERRETRR